MTKETQIEEMATLMTEGARPATEDAEALYNAGYRKASEVAEEIFEEIEKTTASVYNDYMFTRDGVGMRARCVVEFSDELDLAIAELKKKYTEGEN